AREDRQPQHMRALLARGFDDLRGRQADAVVDDLHAGVACAHRDLFSAVRVPVEAGLAEHECQPPSELARYPLDLGAQVVEADCFVARRAPDPGGRAVLAEAFAQSEAPFAGRDAGFGADDGGGHDVAILARRRAQLPERGRDRLLVARAAPRLESRALLA